MSTPTIGDMMAAYAEDAIDFARQNFGIALDYTPESIEQVEKIAERLYNEIPKNFASKLLKRGPSAEDIETVSKMLGGYIGEVYRRLKGGEWAINEELSALGIHEGKTWLFPSAKVFKRLKNGPEDNLWHYFRVISDPPRYNDHA